MERRTRRAAGSHRDRSPNGPPHWAGRWMSRTSPAIEPCCESTYLCRRNMAPIRVFLVDDHPVVREGLRMLLGTSDDLKVIGGASSAEEALAALALTPADVVVLDLDLGGNDGLEMLP